MLNLHRDEKKNGGKSAFVLYSKDRLISELSRTQFGRIPHTLYVQYVWYSKSLQYAPPLSLLINILHRFHRDQKTFPSVPVTLSCTIYY